MATTLLISVSAIVITVSAPSAFASGTLLFNQSFHDNTVDGTAGTVSLPAAPTGTNTACLSASGNATANPLASCAVAPDAQGSGRLRLTPATTTQEGGVFAGASLPTSQGLDVTFNTYQWGGNGADGIAFVLAAVNPSNPVTPALIGQSGGALGYSANGTNAGLTDGYLGVGLDAYGNFSNKYEGSGCTDPANIAKQMPGEVVVRGPGNGTVGYCALLSSAATATSTALVLRSTTRALSIVPVEVVFNPTASSVTTASGLVVPAGDYDVNFTPVGGVAKNLIGAVPVVPTGLYPASWLNTNGTPKQLAFGWVASTGGSTDNHEIDNVVVNSLNAVPTLGVSETSYAGATLVAGSPVTYTVAATSSGATETQPVTVIETVPTGVLPVGATGVGWVCGAPSGQTISCTNSTNPFTSGTITVNAVVTSGTVTPALIQSASTAVASSGDASQATVSSATAGVVPATPVVTGVTPTNGSAGGGNDVTISGTNLAGATAIEVGTTAQFTAGTPTALELCATSAPGCFTVTSALALDISSMPAHASGAVVVKVVSDGIGSSGAYTYNAGPALLFAAPPSGEANVAYSDQLTESGGTSPFTWTVSAGSLPAGVTLSSAGLLAGTPTTAGSSTFTVQVTDAGSLSATKAVTLVVIPGPSLAFATPPGGFTNTVYGDTLTETGGTAPYAWTVSTGSLPAGISLSPDGNLSGTPTATGSSSFTVKVTDTNAQSATEATTLGVTAGVSTTFTAPPNAGVNTAYTDTLTATGGTTPYTWSINAGTLPAGLTLSSAGVLAGTPTAAGTTTFSVNVTDANLGVATKSITLVVVALTLSFAAPPGGEVGVAYTDTLAASGGTAPYTWSVSTGALPAGLSLNASTGVLSGTPSAAGTSSFTVRVTDANSQTVTEATSMTIVAGPALAFSAPPAGEVGAGYTDTLTASGGTTPYVWSVSVGTLPAGLTLGASSGVLSGTPTGSGTSSFTVKVTDAKAQTATEATSVTVVAGPVLAFSAPPSGELNTPYADTLTASGGTTPYVWSVSAGTLPAGVTLNSSTGVLSGTPSGSGTSGFTIKVTDANAQTATEATSISVIAGPVLAFTSPGAAEVGLGYSDTLTASGGNTPYLWSVSAGSLPAGVTLNLLSGVLSGTPTASGTAHFTVQVTDANAQTATEATSVVVIAGPALSFATPPPGEINTSYTDTLVASGGVTPYAWSVTTGSLPAGITLNASTGVLSGTPTASGTFNVTITVTDANSQTATEATSISVIAGPGLAFSTPPAGEINTSYTDTLSASGGVTPYVWSVSTGTLPTGITLNASTGVLSGTPTASGLSSFTIRVTDANGQRATEATSITVVAGPVLAFTSPGAGEVGAGYSDLLSASGGMAPYLWSVSSGSLPAGLSLGATSGLLSGTPTASGTAHFTVMVTDGNSQSATEVTSIIVIAGPALNFATPPAGEISTLYTDTLVASGGVTPYAWSLSTGSLPAGITLNASTGVLSGTPTATGTAHFTVMITDANSQTASEATSVTVVGGPLLGFATPPDGEVNTAYSDTLTTSGGNGPYAWSVSAGSLPAGLALGASSGVLSGTPSVAGTSSFTVEVTDGNNQTVTQATSIRVVAGPVLAFTSPGSGEVGVGYSDTLTASGGNTPYLWSVSVGSLPAGVTLDLVSGVLSGTPTATGTAHFTVEVTDANAQIATEATSVVVFAGPALSFGSPPAGEINTSYTDALTASGGVTPYAWSVSTGSLPAGVTLNASSGLLSGTPTTSARSNFTIMVTDANAQTATEATTINVIAGPALSFATPPAGEINTSYTDTLTASGGITPYVWSVSTGSLPAGVTLNASSGVLSGSPSASGTSSFTIKVTDANGQTAIEATSIRVIAGPVLAFTSPGAGEVGVSYSDTLTASGGNTPYLWSISSGSLPAGLSLGAITGTLSGTPTASGTAHFTVQVTDTNSQTATEATSVVVIAEPALSFATPPAGEISTLYTDTLVASGGVTPYAWSVSTGSLPDGITLNASTGVLSGTPTSSGSSNFTIMVTDANTQSATEATSLTVVGGPTLGFATPPDGEVNTPYADTLPTSGGNGPYIWSVSTGSLPPGLSLGASSGLVSGTPTVVGTSSFTIQVIDGNNQTVTQATSIRVIAGPVLAFTSPGAGEVGVASSDALTASGGTTPYVWSVVAGSLPPGVTLDFSSGVLSGTPTASGTADFTVQVTDANAQTATEATSMTVIAAPGLAFAPPGHSEVGAAYSDTLTATGGVTPYAWSVSAGSLPAGLTLNASTGVLSGTPTASGPSLFTVMVTDANSQTATQATSILVIAGPALAFATPPAGEVGVTYSNALTATGGASPYVWTLSGGSLPAGLALDPATGVMSGIPTAAGRTDFTVQVDDANHQTTTESTSITVIAGPAFSFAHLPDGEINTPYNATLTVIAGVGPYGWSVSSGNLPDGTTLDASTGVISGTPTATGTSNFTIQVEDDNNQTATEATSIRVIDGPSLGFETPAAGEVGAAYSDSLTATDGVMPYTWSVTTGALPDGFTLDEETGVLSGTPTTSGTSNFTVMISDANSQMATEATSITVVNGPALSFDPPATGEIGTPYTEPLIARGGTTPYIWSVSGGTLPAGVNLDASSGALSGTPSASGTSHFTVMVTDASNQTATEATSIAIIAGPRLAFASPPGGEIGAGYTVTLTASGGVTPYAWSLGAGSLPAGLSLDASSGVLSGTPSTAGDSTFSVEVTDGNDQTATEPTSISVVAGPVLGFPAPPAGEINTPYTDTLTTSGGSGPYSWSVSSGTLPAGLGLDASTGVLSGTPSAAGNTTFTVQVTDGNNQTIVEATSITILGGPALVFSAPPAGEVGAGYTDTLTATGGTTPYAWSLSAGTLPAGLTLNATTGTLSGTSSAAATSDFTVEVTDSNDQTATEAAAITVAAGPALAFASLPSGVINTAYAQTLTASGGTSPYVWSVSAGTLPSGMTIDQLSGVLAGTPTVAGTSAFTMMVTDANDQTATESATVMVAPATTLSVSTNSVSYGTPVTFTAAMSPLDATGAVVFTDVLSSGPQSGQIVTLGTVALSGGTASLSVSLPAFNTNQVTATYSGNSTYATVMSRSVGVQVAAYSSELIINEFRLSGPRGAGDQYVELYNTGPAVSLAGFALKASSGASLTVPANVPMLPTGHSYLFTGGKYSLKAEAASDLAATSLGAGGLQITAPDGAGTVVDAVGFVGAKTGFYSGTPLPALIGSPAAQYAWVRLENAGAQGNTTNNAADFKLVSTSGAIVGGVQSTLGSPSPLASGSPNQGNATFLSTLLSPSQSASSAPNFVYVKGSPGLLTIRRTIVNTSGGNVTKAEIHITSLSEANGAFAPGVATQPTSVAALRIVDPATATSQVRIPGRGVVTVQNLSLNAPASASPGGGLNTTLSIPIAGGLASGAAVNIALTFAVDHGGTYWFSYDVDALAGGAPAGVKGGARAVKGPIRTLATSRWRAAITEDLGMDSGRGAIR